MIHVCIGHTGVALCIRAVAPIVATELMVAGISTLRSAMSVIVRVPGLLETEEASGETLLPDEQPVNSARRRVNASNRAEIFFILIVSPPFFTISQLTKRLPAEAGRFVDD
ncbi:hypothetical protein [Desulfofarcimen acetoxidans]|uniref:hypothetical protein n=1 Tax=Desulfofarcimen acetoxidans TaxID=58138 RepID=UPI00031CBEAC|nr:hypothetical protein [Desulfofarcimen acetoxidans]